MHYQNLLYLRKQLAQTANEAKRQQIVRQLAEEELKDEPLIKEE